MLQLDIFIIIAQLINFGILYYIFKRFIADKLNAKIQTRKAELEKLKTADIHYAEKMQLAEAQRKIMIEEARKTSRSLMKESEMVAKAQAEAIIKKAHAEVEAILGGGRRELEKERLSMLAQMKTHIIDVSLRLNEKMFGPGKTNKEFIEKEFTKMK